MAEWTGGVRPRRRSRMAEEKAKAMRREIPELPPAPGAMTSPQAPGTVPDRSTVPGHWGERVPPLQSVLRPLTEYGTAQHIADIYAPSGEDGSWTARDFEQSPASYEELRRADPRLMPPLRPVPGYDTARALAQREERTALGNERTAELAAHAESAASAGGQADHAVSPGQAAEATVPGAIGGADQAAPAGAAAGSIPPLGAPPTSAEIAEIPVAATPLAAAGAASGPPAAGEISEGTTQPAAPVLPTDQQTTSRTGLAAPAEAVANAAEAIAPPVVPSEPDKVVGPVGAGQADQDRSRWAEAAPPPGMMTDAAMVAEAGAAVPVAPRQGESELGSAAAPAIDPARDRSPQLTTPDVREDQNAGSKATSDRPADLPTPAEGWSANIATPGDRKHLSISSAERAALTRTEPETPARPRAGSGRPLRGGESIRVVPTGMGDAVRLDRPSIVAPESEPEPPTGEVEGDAFETALAESGVGDAAAVGGTGVVGGPGVAEGSFQPTAAPVARDVAPAGGPTGAERRGSAEPGGSDTAVTPPGEVASVADAGIVGAEAIPVREPGAPGNASSRPDAKMPANAIHGSGKLHCPPGFPVKVRLASGTFHLPDEVGYEQVSPEFCFTDAVSAEAAGYTPAHP